MGRALRDGNFKPTMIGVLNTDGKTIVAVQANPSTNTLLTKDASTGSDNGPNHALKDVNNVNTLLVVSSTDGITPVPLYVDSSGNLLIQSS